MDIPNTILKLKTQVKHVLPEHAHPAFHFNTKFCHLLSSWQRSGKFDEHDTASEFSQWFHLAAKVVACLPPEMRVPDGESMQHVDPFLELRDVFRSNQREDFTQLPSFVEAMMHTARVAGLTHTMTSHENLVELATLSGLLNSSEESNFFHTVCHRPTPQEVISDMTNDLEAESAMGITDLECAPCEFTIAKHKVTKGCVTALNGASQLRINGYGGCLCRFPLIISPTSVIVLQEKTHQGTSITNLTESIVATMQEYFPGRRIFEAYEHDFDIESPAILAEISLDNYGEAGWLYTEDPKLTGQVHNYLSNNCAKV